jgi:hypothetical protein
MLEINAQPWIEDSYIPEKVGLDPGSSKVSPGSDGLNVRINIGPFWRLGVS